MNGNQGIFKSILGLHHIFFEVMRSQMGEGDAHPRQGPILGLLLHKSGVSQAELVREMNVSAATVAVSLARLEKLGLVARERNQSNQRANVLTLTPKGRAEAARMHQLMFDIGDKALEGFSKQEIQEAASYFQRMKDNLRKHYDIKECDRSRASDD